MIVLDQMWTGLKTGVSAITGLFDGIMDGWGGFADFAWPWLPIAGAAIGGIMAGGGALGMSAVEGMIAGGLVGTGAVVAGGAVVGLANGVWRGTSDAVSTVTASNEPEVQPELQPEGEEVTAQVTPDARDKDKSRAVV